MGEREPRSYSARPWELLPEIREVFESVGYGCLVVESNLGILHVCCASDRDITGFADRSAISRWELIEMPTDPLIRLELAVLDRPDNPFIFESFLNADADDQAQVITELANQDMLHMAFYGDSLTYRSTKFIDHSEQ